MLPSTSLPKANHLSCGTTHISCCYIHLSCLVTHLSCIDINLFYLATRFSRLSTYFLLSQPSLCMLTWFYLPSIFLSYRHLSCLATVHSSAFWFWIISVLFLKDINVSIGILISMDASHRSRDEKRRNTKNISKRGLGLSLVVERVEEGTFGNCLISITRRGESQPPPAVQKLLLLIQKLVTYFTQKFSLFS